MLYNIYKKYINYIYNQVKNYTVNLQQIFISLLLGSHYFYLAVLKQYNIQNMHFGCVNIFGFHHKQCSD